MTDKEDSKVSVEQEGLRLLDSILTSSYEALISIDGQGKIRTCNRAASKMFGYGENALVGKKVNLLMAEPYRSQHDDYLKSYRTGKKKVIGNIREVRGMRRNGTSFPLSIAISEAVLSDGHIYVGILRDLTRGKIEREKLMKSDAALRSSLEATADGILALDSEGRVAFVNSQFTDFWKLTPELIAEGVVSDKIFDVLRAQLINTKPIEICQAKECLENPEMLLLSLHDGRVCELYVYPRKQDDELVGKVLSIRDVTQRYHAEENSARHAEALRQSRAAALSIMEDSNAEKLRAEKALAELAASQEERNILAWAIEQSPISVIITNAGAEVEYVNTAFTRTTGYSLEEVKGHTRRILKPENMSEADYQNQWSEIRNDKNWSGELRSRKKNGEIYWESALVAPMHNDNGEVTHFVILKEDITERKLNEREIVKAREEAEAATLAKSNFLATMSHEIRTPMNAIIGMSHLAMQTATTSKQMNYLNKIDLAAHTLLDIINDILDFSKVEAGQIVLESIKFRLEDVLHNVSNLAGIKAFEKGLELVFDIQPDIPSSLVGDPLRLGQVITNLLNNATKFTEQGCIVLKVELLSEEAEQALLKFSVQDTGIGMSTGQQDKLFKAFSQADNSTTRKYGGTGLGLAISQRFVELMHGEISVTSEYGKGSTFTFTARFGLQPYIETQKAIDAAIGVKGLHVLIVDDDDLSRKALSNMLGNLGCEVDDAASGMDAINRLEAALVKGKPVQLLLIDWNMPDMNGVEAIRKIRERHNLVQLPYIIMVTTYAREKVIHMSEDIEIDHFLYKPVTPSLLLDTIMETISKQSNGRIRKSFLKKVDQKVVTGLAGNRLLLVEDNEINQEVAMELLSNIGIFVEIANNGKEALEILDKMSFDGVLMDIQMPVMDGYIATRAIRKQKRFKDLPIIAMTANVMSKDREKCLDAGMNDFISKPVNVTEMFATIAKWILPSDVKVAIGTSETKPELTEDELLFEHLKDVDTQTGMTIMQGNPKLYQKLLIKFRKNYSHFAEDFQSALLSDDPSTAVRVAHTLKGAAANLGIKGVQDIAQELEEACDTGQPKTTIKRQLANVEKALAPVLKSLAGLQEKKQTLYEEISSGSLSITELTAKTQAIAQLLIRNDTAAVDEMENLMSQAQDVPQRTLLAQVMNLTSRFEFDGAIDVLKQFAGKVNIDLNL